MSTATDFGHATVSALRVSNLLKRYWSAFQERRNRERLRADLSGLSDRELIDIGISRGEVDYVVSNQSTDPRGIRSSLP